MRISRMVLCGIGTMILAVGSPGRAEVLGVPAPFATVQSAIDAAAPGDTVLVEPGAYPGPIDLLGKGITVMSSSGPELTVLEGGGSSVVAFRSGESRDAILDGFTIRGGEGTEYVGTDPGCYGGGIFIEDSSPTIRGNIIEDNETRCCSPCPGGGFGGGIAIVGSSSALIENNLIRRNTTALPGVNLAAGGGIYCQTSAEIEILGNVIANNVATEGGGGGGLGGGINMFGRFGTVEGNVIRRNHSYFGGGIAGGAGSGGGTDFIEFRGNVVERNSAVRAGGGMSMLGACIIEANTISWNDAVEQGGGLRLLFNDAQMRDNVVEGNRAEFGGGVHLSSPGHVSGNRIKDNGAVDGAGIYCDGCSTTIVGNTIDQNLASRDGGGLFLDDNARPIAVHNTIHGNEASTGGGAYFGDLSGSSGAGLFNSIVWANEADIGADVHSVGKEGGFRVEFSDIGGGFVGAGNVDVDPRFVNAGEGDFHLRLGSPVLDAAMDHSEALSEDDEGDPRSLDGDGDGIALPDMGADELLREHAALFGTVHAGAGLDDSFVVSVLSVNGAFGDRRRELHLDAHEGISFEISLPPAGGAGKFVVHANAGAPDSSSLTVLPSGIGVSGFGMLLTTGASPSAIFNNIGKTSLVGESTYFDGTPIAAPMRAPATLLDLPMGDPANLPPGFVFTLQGVIVDPATAASRPVSLTNGLVVTME